VYLTGELNLNVQCRCVDSKRKSFHPRWGVTSLSAIELSLSKLQQVYQRRYESRRSPKSKLPVHKKQKKHKIRQERFSIWRMEFFHPAMWHVAMRWRAIELTKTFAIGILLLVLISTISPQSTSHSAPVCEILSKSYRPHLSTKNWRHVDFQDGQSPPSWILGVQY